MLKTSRLISKGLFPILIALLATALGVAAWASRRGFDFIDGGLYYLTYQWPQDFADTHTSYHLLGSSVFRLLGDNIVALRLTTVGFALVSAFTLSWGFGRWFAAIDRWSENSFSHRVSTPLFLLTSFALFTIAPPALTYNSLNAFVAFISTGFLLAALARFSSLQDNKSTVAWVFLGAACLSAGFDLFIKPPTSLLLVGAILTYGFLTPVISRKTKVRIAGLVAASGILGLVLFGLVLGQWSAVLARLETIRSLIGNSDYTAALLTRVQKECSDLVLLLAHDLWPFLVAVIIAAAGVVIFRGNPRRLRVAGAVGGAVIWILWLKFVVEIPAWHAAQEFFEQAAVSRFYLGTIIVLALCLALSAFALRKSDPSPDGPSHAFHLALGLIMLTLLPFAGAFGTTNPLYLNAAYHAPFWCAVLVALTVILQDQWRAPWLAVFIWPVVGGVALAQYFNGAVIHPYALTTSLEKQNIATAVGFPSTTLLLDEPSSRFIEQARQILAAHGFKPGDDIFAFFNLPGLVFALGGRSPVVPWYFGRIYAANGIEESYMQAAGSARREQAWVVTQADAPRFREHYRAGGLDFPDNYDLIGELKNPVNAMDIKIWKPRRIK